MKTPPEQTGEAQARGQALREMFLLRPDMVFLNHGSFGACPRPVFEVYQNWQRELEQQPVEFLGRRFKQLLHASRSALGDYFCVHPNDLVYVPNATTGLNVVARSLPLQPGDEVLATDHEYGALDRTWRFVCQKRGGRYVNQTLNLPVETREQVVEVIITCWRDLQLIRVSVQAYNSQSDLDRLDAALSTLFSQLQRR